MSTPLNLQDCNDTAEFPVILITSPWFFSLKVILMLKFLNLFLFASLIKIWAQEPLI
jgi:hypothetical protein